MAAVFADLRELTCPLSAFAAFQLSHFCPPGIKLFMVKDNSLAGKSAVDTDLVLNPAVLPHLLYTYNCTVSRAVVLPEIGPLPESETIAYQIGYILSRGSAIRTVD